MSISENEIIVKTYLGFSMMSRSSLTSEDCNLLPVKLQVQRIVIQNSYGEKLVGKLHETGSTEVVMVCHGFRSCKDRIPMLNLAAAFAIEGISAFRFDFAGNGESEGSFQYGNYYREVDDLRAVMQYFEHEKRSVAAIIGHSNGGNVVLLYASRFNDVHNVVNISGRFDLKRGIEGRLGNDYLQRIKKYGSIDVANRKGNIEYRVTEESLMDRLTTDTSAACQLIPQNCRVLSIHGSADKIVPMEDATEFAKHIFNHRLHIINGADHEYTDNESEDSVDKIADFQKEDDFVKIMMIFLGDRQQKEDCDFEYYEEDGQSVKNGGCSTTPGVSGSEEQANEASETVRLGVQEMISAKGVQVGVK